MSVQPKSRDSSMGSTAGRVPVDLAQLDGLLEAAGADALLATSPHNLQYLLGGYRYFMYTRMDSIGLSRYQPVLAYATGAPEATTYIGAGNEDWGTEVESLWPPAIQNVAWGGRDAAEATCRWLRDNDLDGATIAVEPAYLSAELLNALSAELPSTVRMLDATEVLEEVRAVKRPDELEIVREASTAVVEAMLATFRESSPGETKAEITERLRLEQSQRGLHFAYCLIAAGSSHNRAPSAQRLQPGEILSLDSGADRFGYVADLTRMAIAGEPSEIHEELLAEVAAIQSAARSVVRSGTNGREVFDAAEERIRGSEHSAICSFLAHGCGLVTHEAPRLTSTGSPPYPAKHANQPLREGMVLSVETHLAHPSAGFVKLEDTLIVTDGGYEAVGDHGRGWNAIGG